MGKSAEAHRVAGGIKLNKHIFFVFANCWMHIRFVPSQSKCTTVRIHCCGMMLWKCSQLLQLEGETFWSVESAIADPTERDCPATAPKPCAATVTTTATGTAQGRTAYFPCSKLQQVDLFGTAAVIPHNLPRRYKWWKLNVFVRIARCRRLKVRPTSLWLERQASNHLISETEFY